MLNKKFFYLISEEKKENFLINKRMKELIIAIIFFLVCQFIFCYKMKEEINFLRQDFSREIIESAFDLHDKYYFREIWSRISFLEKQCQSICK